MPYGLPPLSQADVAILDAWVSRGAPGPSPYERLVNRFGIRRSNEKSWSVFDTLNKAYLAADPVHSGTLDLTRYSLEQK